MYRPDDLPYAYGKPQVKGLLRQHLSDFIVEEQLGFEPAGEGEHVFLYLEKRDLNTQQLAEQICRLAKVHPRLVSYSGMKDKQAVTRQWFSVHLPGTDSIDWPLLNNEHVKLLGCQRHLRKLRRGVHSANRFVITLRELAGDTDSLPARIASIATGGVPNYFGEQRFGQKGSNLQQAEAWFRGEFKPRRNKRSFYLSAARSFLFNRVLAARLQRGSLTQALSGELLMLEGSNSLFVQDQQADLQQRLDSGDIHLTGPLFGKASGLQPSLETADFESRQLQQFPLLLDGLLAEGLTAERRALRVIPQQLEWLLDDDRLQVSFTLPSGCFATAVMRELAQYRLPET